MGVFVKMSICSMIVEDARVDEEFVIFLERAITIFFFYGIDCRVIVFMIFVWVYYYY